MSLTNIFYIFVIPLSAITIAIISLVLFKKSKRVSLQLEDSLNTISKELYEDQKYEIEETNKPTIYTLPKDENLDKWEETSKNIIKDIVIDQIFGSQIAKWNKGVPQICSLHHFTACQNNIYEIEALGKNRDVDSWLFEPPSPKNVNTINATTKYIRNVLSDILIGDDDANVCAIFAATRILRKYSASIPGPLEELSESINKTKDYILACWARDEKSGNILFRHKPGAEGKETLFTIYCGCGAYDNVTHLSKKHKNIPENEKELLQAAAKKIQKYREKINGKTVSPQYAYAYEMEKGEKSRCISATYHALRATVLIDSLLEGHEFVNYNQPVTGGKYAHDCLKDPLAQGLLNFIKECYDNEFKGFNPNDSVKKPNIFHTRYALQILRLLIIEHSIDLKALYWIPASDIIEFITSCYFMGGFSIMSIKGKSPDNIIQPDLLTTMAAINCVKLLEIFRLKHVYIPDAKYKYYLNMLKDNFPLVEKFINYHISTVGFEPLTYPLTDYKIIKSDRDLITSSIILKDIDKSD